MRLYDISRTVGPQIAVWPGDTPFSYDVVMSKAAGASVNLTTLHLSAHTGTHADAYWHYDADGLHPAEMPLEKYIGPAQVISLKRAEGGITPGELAGIDLAGAERVVFHTPASRLPDQQWSNTFAYLTVELIDFLAERDVILIGLDAPSVDHVDSKELPCHHRLLAHGMVNLESLQLTGVPDGRYELIALPLRIGEVCGSPVRAILREGV